MDRGDPPCPYQIWCFGSPHLTTPIFGDNRNKLWMERNNARNIDTSGRFFLALWPKPRIMCVTDHHASRCRYVDPEWRGSASARQRLPTQQCLLGLCALGFQRNNPRLQRCVFLTRLLGHRAHSFEFLARHEIPIRQPAINHGFHRGFRLFPRALGHAHRVGHQLRDIVHDLVAGLHRQLSLR